MHSTILRRLIDYLLLNACSVRSTGLYSGKAGFALTLAELAYTYDDEYLGDRAYDLLEESLLSSTEDPSLEHGLAGIGFVLIHFISRGFVEVNLEELFASQHKHIIHSLNKECEIQGGLRIAYYLLTHYQQTKDEVSLKLLTELLERHARVLAGQLHQLKDYTHPLNKYQLSISLELYLSVLCSVGLWVYPSLEVLQLYAEALHNHRLKSDYFMGADLHLLHQMGLLPQTLGLESTINRSLTYGAQDLHLRSLDLRKALRLLQCYTSLRMFHQRDELLRILDLTEPSEEALLRLLPPRYYRPGYEGGVARYLLYHCSCSPTSPLGHTHPLFL